MIQAYFRFVLTVLLLVASFGSVYAFNIIPAQNAALKSFVPSEAYELKGGKKGIVTRQPISFASIPRGGTEDFLAELKSEFPESEGWKFISAMEDLKGSFSVSAYYVFFNGTLGGGLSFDYVPSVKDPVTAGNTELHWIQRIVSNHKRKLVHGIAENRIVFWESGNKKKQPDVPFFDVIPKVGKRSQFAYRAIPPHFKYDVGKNDPENDHQWNSEVYLVSNSIKEPKTVIIYNGVSWGWVNNVESVPAR